MKKNQKRKRNPNAVQQQGSFQNAWLSQFGWLIFDKESQICGVCVCVWIVVLHKKMGFQNLYHLELFE